MNDNPGRIVYVYGFVRTETGPARPVASPGVDESDSPAVRPFFGGVAAIASSVAKEDFTGEKAEANLSDLAWLAPRVVRHQRVLEEFMSRGPVLPARFGTLFSSEKAMTSFIENHATVISSFLDRMENLQEWSVKGFVDRGIAEPVLLARLRGAEEDADLSPGASFLRDEMRRGKMRDAVEEMAGDACEELLEELALLAEESCERRLLPKNNEETAVEMIANYAFLLPVGNVETFRQNVGRVSCQHAQEGLTFCVSGPWPLYSFSPQLSDPRENPDADSSGTTQ